MLLDVALFHSFSWLLNIPYSKRMRWLEGINDATDMNLGKLQEILRDREAWSTVVQGSQRAGRYWATEQNNKYSAVRYTYRHTHTPFIVFIISSVEGHLDCFHISAILNTAAVNMNTLSK